MVKEKNLVERLRETALRVLKSQEAEEAKRKKLLEINPDDPEIVRLKERIIKEIVGRTNEKASYGSREAKYRVKYTDFCADIENMMYYREKVKNREDEKFVRKSADNYAIKYILPDLKKLFDKGSVKFKGNQFEPGSPSESEGDGCFGLCCGSGSTSYYYQLYRVEW